MRKAVHSSSSSRTPRTLGAPAMRTLKLQAKLSSKVVSLKSFCISFSGSVPRFKSMVIFKPSRSVSSRMSAISLTLFCRTRSTTFSTMISTEVEGGIWVMSMQPAALS